MANITPIVLPTRVGADPPLAGVWDAAMTDLDTAFGEIKASIEAGEGVVVDSVTTESLVNGSVGDSEFAAGAITADKLSEGFEAGLVGELSLGDFTDVDTTNPSEGDLLTWDGVKYAPASCLVFAFQASVSESVGESGSEISDTAGTDTLAFAGTVPLTANDVFWIELGVNGFEENILYTGEGSPAGTSGRFTLQYRSGGSWTDIILLIMTEATVEGGGNGAYYHRNSSVAGGLRFTAPSTGDFEFRITAHAENDENWYLHDANIKLTKVG